MHHDEATNLSLQNKNNNKETTVRLSSQRKGPLSATIAKSEPFYQGKVTTKTT